MILFTSGALVAFALSSLPLSTSVRIKTSPAKQEVEDAWVAEVAVGLRSVAATLGNSSCVQKACVNRQEAQLLSLAPTEPALSLLIEHTVFTNDTVEVDGWKLTGQADLIQLRQKGNECWLKFQGMRPGGLKIAANFSKGVYTNVCGIKDVWAPLLNDWDIAFKNESWPDMANALSTCAKVTVSGTSWGGAMGSLITSCATNGRLHDIYSSELPTFNVHALFTFGGFVPTPTALRNMSTKDGCFNGGHFFFPNDPIARFIPDLLHHHRPLGNIVRFGVENKYLGLHYRTCKDHTRSTIRVPHNVQAVSALAKVAMLHACEQEGVRESLDLVKNWINTCLGVPPCGE